MSIDLVQHDHGGAGLRGKDEDQGAIIMASAEWIADSVDKYFFIAPRALRVVGITARVGVAGTDASAVTAAVKKSASGDDIANDGTALHSGTINLKGTIDVNQALTLSTTAGVLNLEAGDALSVDFTGTLTAAVGALTVAMVPR